MTERRRVVYLNLGAPHLEYAGVEVALQQRDVDAVLVHLDAVDDVDWDAVNLVSMRMCRGYPARPDFIDRVNRLHDRLVSRANGPVQMVNSIELAREAIDKGVYLPRLEKTGIDLVPTRWIPRGSDVRMTDIMQDTGWSDIVIKPTVSAGSWRTFRVSRSGVSTSESHIVIGDEPRSPEHHLRQLTATHDVSVQLFLPAILDEGELSFVFLGGALSHVVRKTVGDGGGWWAHERLGGVNHRVEPSAVDIAWASEVYQAIERLYGPVTFGRVDGIRGPDGKLRLLECELAIPRLLLPEGEAFQRYAEVIVSVLDRSASFGRR
ncbi:hypothetical protein [Lentzea flaviverrucosa]|uniref:ATP-grasp domain-containing protein n=1 Tax=Lentzea flaviverrucosa TaxID=200379 RepID=A0A1H9XTN5_9PSEU|nr:hypothetical protein [Lentzea flaviverrucosa]RDI19321.1 hypothetical protein DFR72_117163 [Lentzea flaviverrucosa]SES49053.1 hypothetical protein SAMN05216195_11754 [Lentzea flaviverrucosa]